MLRRECRAALAAPVASSRGLRRTGGNISLAARLCGKERSGLGKLVKKHGLERLAFASLP